MADINGTFSSWGTDKGYPIIRWSVTSQDIINNTSTIQVTLIFKRTGAYYAYNFSTHSNTGSIDGQTDGSSDTDFDLRPGTGEYSLRSFSKTVTHNSDGTKSVYIGWSGNTNVSPGTYNFGATVALPTIPREAYITNTPNFTIGTSPVALNLWNDGSLYCKIDLYVDGTLIKTVNAGQVTSYNFTLGSTENDAMYAEMPSATSASGYFRVRTYTSGSYSVQVGGNKDKAITVSVNQTTNKPTFVDYDLFNVDKSIAVVDKYANTLVTSSTDTLLGATDRFIKGYSKVRARVEVADKMVALNAATAVKYRHTNGAQQIEQSYSAVADVDLDIDNVLVNSFDVTAFDSRNLTTVVNKTLSVMAEYSAVQLFNLAFTRDNGVDAGVTMSFGGQFWKKYFSSNTTSNPGFGVLNAITCEYRYKETTDAWGAQSWDTITPSSDSAGVISFSDYIDGDLGVSGFDPEKSYNVEVRLFDKLSQVIVEGTINVGTPVVHFTKDGVAIKGRYDPLVGGSLQVDGQQVGGLPVGGIAMTAQRLVAPSGYLFCDGAAVDRDDYENLFEAIVPLIGTFTVTIASPGVATLTAHGLQTGDRIYLTTTGALPTGLSQNTIYYAIRVTADTIRFASSFANANAGTAINTSGTQSGTHSMRFCPYGLGDGSTTFNVPDFDGRVPVGYDVSQAEFDTLGIASNTGAKTHTLVTGEMPSHSHTQNSHNHNQDSHGHRAQYAANMGSGGFHGPNSTGGAYKADNTWIENRTATNQATTATNQNTGGGGAHNNLQPYLVVNFIIKY